MYRYALTYLSQLTKDRIVLILRFFGQNFSRNDRKAELLSLAAHYLAENPVSWMFQLPECDLNLLKKLCHTYSGHPMILDAPEYPSLLSAMHLFVEGENDMGDITLSAPEFLLDLCRPFIDDVIEDKERMGLFKPERIALGTLNIFGIIEMTEFAQILWDMTEKKTCDVPPSAIAGTSVVAMHQMSYNGRLYMVSPFLVDYENILKGRKDFKKVRKYAHITIDEAIAAGRGAPNCAYGVGGPALEAVRAALLEIGYKAQETDAILSDIWLSSQFTQDEVYAEAMFRYVNDKIDEIPSFEDYKRIVETIAAYANSTPKWMLRGRKAEDVNLMKLSIRVDEGVMDEADEIWSSDRDEENGRFDPLEAFYKNNMAVRHVHPDAPCPCGSGLSYKNCHGRKLN